jgi:hypothetical protein
LRKEVIDIIGAEMGQRDCFSPCSWWMRLASEDSPGLERCHGNVKARKGCSQNLIVSQDPEVQERAWSPDISWPYERAKPLTARGQQRKRWAPMAGSASGNSDPSTVKFPAGMAIILGCEESAARMGLGAGGQAKGRRSTVTLRGGFYSSEMWMRGMTNGVRLRTLYLSRDFVPVEPFMQAIHTLHSSWPASPSPQETLLSVLCTPQSLLPAALTFHGRYWEVPLQSILIPFLGEIYNLSSSCVARSK